MSKAKGLLEGKKVLVMGWLTSTASPGESPWR